MADSLGEASVSDCHTMLYCKLEYDAFWNQNSEYIRQLRH